MLGWLAKKGRDVIALERELIAAPGLSKRQRLELFVRRHAAVLGDARTFRYLGRQFSYDNRLLPLLLPSYLGDVERLASHTVMQDQPCVLDVGANVGQFAATFLWRFPGSRIWSFEPNAGIVRLLRQNASSVEHWQVFPWGIGADDGDATLWSVEEKSAQASLFRSNAVADLRKGDARAHSVQIRSLTRDLADSIQIPECVDLIKIDVEGAEESVLRGLAAVRWRYMAIELSLDREGGLRLEQALDLAEHVWGQKPDVLWRSNPTGPARTEDAILALAAGSD
jgi:FkbM family methyltransferase